MSRGTIDKELARIIDKEKTTWCEKRTKTKTKDQDQVPYMPYIGEGPLFMYKDGSDWFVTQDHNWSPHAMQPFWRCQCNPLHLELDFIPKHLATRGTCSEGTAKRKAIVGKGLQLQRWLSKLCVRHFSNLADANNGTRPQRDKW